MQKLVARALVRSLLWVAVEDSSSTVPLFLDPPPNSLVQILLFVLSEWWRWW